MTYDANDVSSQQVDAAIAEYLEAVKLGAPPDHDSFIARHQEVADELQQFLADHHALDGAAQKAAAGVSTDGNVYSTGRLALPRRRPLAAPQKFGKFELLEEIARGGMGVVYKAQQATPSRIVALKMILAGQFASKADVERFYVEAHAAAALDHPSIVPIFEVGEHDGQHYYTMAFVDGQSLGQRLSNGPIAAKEAATITSDVARAVAYAHERGVVHRDLKPANILIDSNGRVRVTDFGLAKRQADDSGLTRTGELLGTPSFMAPEQVSGDASRIGPASDVYSLGATLYALITGRPPFQAASTVDTLKQVLDQDPVPPRDLDATIPRDLETIVLKCLEKDPNRRYESAAALAADLNRYLSDEPVLARPATGMYRAKKFVRRNKVAVFAVAAIFVALVTGVTGTSIGLVGQSRQRAIADEQRADAKRQAQEAKNQAAIAVAVNEFLTDMLMSASPELGGEKLTVLEAINAAIKELDAGKRKDPPLVEAGVRGSIGISLRGLGRYEEAAQSFRRAIELQRQVLPPGHPDIALYLIDLGNTLSFLDQFDESERLLTDAIAIEREALAPTDPKIARGLSVLAEVLIKKRRLLEAKSRLNEALSISGDDKPGSFPFAARDRIMMAGIFQQEGNYAEAERLLQQALATIRSILPPKHPLVGLCLNNLVLVLQAQGNLPAAADAMHEALDIAREVYPAGNRDLAVGLTNYALLLRALGKPDESEKAFREAVDIFRAVFPNGHTDTADCLVNFSYLLQDEGKIEDAVEVCSEALEINSKSLPPRQFNTALTRAQLGSLMAAQGKLADAETHYRQAVGEFERAADKSDGRTADARMGLGNVLVKLDRFPDAEVELLEAQRVFTVAKGVPTGKHAESIAALVSLYTAWDKAEPGKGHDAQAQQWQAKLTNRQPAAAAT